MLEPDPGAEKVRRQVQQIASGLLDQSAIPVIRAQQHLLDEVAGDQWWVDVTLPMLELMRRRLRALVKLLAKTKQVIVYTGIPDEVGELKEIPGPDPRRHLDRRQPGAAGRVGRVLAR